AEQADGHEAGKNSVIAHRASPVACLWNWSSQSTPRAPTRRDPPPPAPTAAYDPAVPETRRGLLFGVAAYAMWGFFPLYWRLLEETGALELLAARVTFSLLVMVVLVLALRRLETFGAMVRDRRLRWLLTMAAVLISGNWFMFIWGVNNGRVLEISLGYFITPLVSVLLGVVVLRERLRATQWAAAALALVAVVVLALDYGRLPW